MLTHNLGYPRIGSQRELKRANEQYWSGKSTLKNLLAVGRDLRQQHWQLQRGAGIDLIPSNDFSFYDHVLDMSLTVNAIPPRYHDILMNRQHTEMDLYFAMARGYQQHGFDLKAMEMTKWFDTNYHYIVPEFYAGQSFSLFSTKIIDEFYEARQLGIVTKPVLLGPVSYLLLGKEKEANFHRLDLLPRLLPVYREILSRLDKLNASWIQFDEPFLALDLTTREQEAFSSVYQQLRREFPSLKLMITTYFDGLRDNLKTATTLPVHALHIDLVRAPDQLQDVLQQLPDAMMLSLGIVDGRNVWRNDYQRSLHFVQQAINRLGASRVMIAPSCSLLHSPCDLQLEADTQTLDPEVKSWMAFAVQKLAEVNTLRALAVAPSDAALRIRYDENQHIMAQRRQSVRTHHPAVHQRMASLRREDEQRQHPFAARQPQQHEQLGLPLLPTTTIGSFPQTTTVRQWRAQWKKGSLDDAAYTQLLQEEIARAIHWQESIGLDVLVHGEFERNDMVEYFGEQLAGYTFTQHGWVQSYGSRCVKPPVIYGDVYRPAPMTVSWTTYAQSLTSKPVKGMLTGPVTMLQWSFVRDDQPRQDTCTQIALAIRDEVMDLERAGIHIIQIDEPALREGLPLRQADRTTYLHWAVRAFRLSACGVADTTQIHTHMCYAAFNDIMAHIADMDADVITLETSRSQMELLDAFAAFQYPNEVGPGLYDIHSPRVPGTAEMVELLEKAIRLLPVRNVWVNPDCGLKTRQWPETEAALRNMLSAARQIRQDLTIDIA